MAVKNRGFLAKVLIPIGSGVGAFYYFYPEASLRILKKYFEGIKNSMKTKK